MLHVPCALDLPIRGHGFSSSAFGRGAWKWSPSSNNRDALAWSTRTTAFIAVLGARKSLQVRATHRDQPLESSDEAARRSISRILWDGNDDGFTEQALSDLFAAALRLYTFRKLSREEAVRFSCVLVARMREKPESFSESQLSKIATTVAQCVGPLDD
eukprot:1925517-Amphidinium_carterae.1